MTESLYVNLRALLDTMCDAVDGSFGEMLNRAHKIPVPQVEDKSEGFFLLFSAALAEAAPYFRQEFLKADMPNICASYVDLCANDPDAKQKVYAPPNDNQDYYIAFEDFKIYAAGWRVNIEGEGIIPAKDSVIDQNEAVGQSDVEKQLSAASCNLVFYPENELRDVFRYSPVKGVREKELKNIMAAELKKREDCLYPKLES